MSINWGNLIISYVALLITIIGCELFLGYLVNQYAPDCIEENEVAKEGKISFNPLNYIDWLGSVIFPLAMLLFQAPLLFGWSKNLSVHMGKVINLYGINLAILFASSGIFFHFFIAFLSSIFISSIPIAELKLLFTSLVIFNIFFVFIKLCPILPYEGLKLLGLIGLKFGSETLMRFYATLLPYGMPILIVIAITPLKQIILIPATLMFQFLL